ncbi:DUF4174 domain-containing protein [Hymenobacter aerilatus]|uniref:DUF4174 domain-containing protein n=1 Tax=Hymenobacter aerilatus TaxID=2932251 RepID=A0A8T9T0U2_9BACT|nr:DUF4174 domain-containing protein [Hymenobacter aerilatus]UOR05659.1 DUF4174 domain-containing protein [Hymenobacter aerilatus]
MNTTFRCLGVLSGVGLLLTVLLGAAPPASLAATLKANQWKKRVLLLHAPTAADATLKRQRALLAAQLEGLSQRDMLVLNVIEDQLSTADSHYVRQELKLPADSFTVVLIGKDGGVKQRSATPLPPNELFGTIDKMPMRRQEMRSEK